MSEQTFFMIKPDGVARGLVGEVIRRIENKGLKIVALEMRAVDHEVAVQHYAEHVGKPFYDPLMEFITSGPVVCGIAEGEDAIAAWRQISGGTNPVRSAAPGSLRGDYCCVTKENLVHGSDSPDSAAREIAIWFPHFAVEGK